MKAPTPETATPPRLLASLVSGFDSITLNIGLLIFPIGLDLLLWLGPHLRIKQMIEAAMSQLFALTTWQDPATVEMIKNGQEAQQWLSEHLNLASATHSFPVGLPSLMAGRLPIESPLGVPAFIEITDPGMALVLWGLLSILGLILGALYYEMVMQAVLAGRVHWRQTLTNWPKVSGQILLLTGAMLLALLAISLPVFCVTSVLILSGPAAAQCVWMIYGILLLWMIFPLVFSTHGIFVYKDAVWVSIQKSIHITRLTAVPTGALCVIVLLLTQGMESLWNVTAENSWLSLIGIGGHAFISTGLLAATFIYYRDANAWITRLREAQATGQQPPQAAQ